MSLNRPKCPLCDEIAYPVDRFDCGNFDGSRLYRYADILWCPLCHHAFNHLNYRTMEGIEHYYDQEYAQINGSSIERYGDLPGSDNTLTLKRYDHLHWVISPFLEPGSTIVDVGCASGGFISHLRSKGFEHAIGVEPSETYRVMALHRGIKVKEGSAENLPLDDGVADIVVADQVMEHVADPGAVFEEFARVLKMGGRACISVPDAEAYESTGMFPFYWFIMREHLHHFSSHSLLKVAALHGFRMLAIERFRSGMMSDEMVLPSLTVVFELQRAPEALQDASSGPREDWLPRYMESSQVGLRKARSRIHQLPASLICWGIGREFHFLFANRHLWPRRLLLIDGNIFKQEHLTVEGMLIHFPAAIALHPDVPILVTATAHASSIRTSVERMSCRNTLVEML